MSKPAQKSFGFLSQVFTRVQGESAEKKLAQGDVPPLLLKTEESDGPEFAFGFLKMWKLRLPLFIDHVLASILLAIIAIAPQRIRYLIKNQVIRCLYTRCEPNFFMISTGP